MLTELECPAPKQAGLHALHCHTGVSSDLPPVAQEEEENGIGDVDLFTLVDEGGGLEVNAKWLQHLQERLLGEDGHPRKVCLTQARGCTLAAVFEVDSCIHGGSAALAPAGHKGLLLLQPFVSAWLCWGATPCDAAMWHSKPLYRASSGNARLICACQSCTPYKQEKLRKESMNF